MGRACAGENGDRVILQYDIHYGGFAVGVLGPLSLALLHVFAVSIVLARPVEFLSLFSAGNV